jgi:hypothetical protein
MYVGSVFQTMIVKHAWTRMKDEGDYRDGKQCGYGKFNNANGEQSKTTQVGI